MPDDVQVVMVYITAASETEAEGLSAMLVEHRLAACVNILGAIRSVYAWKGTVERSVEVAMVAKTTAERFPALEKAVRERHSYECPCIVAWPLTQGHGPFLDWVKQQTK